MDASKLTELESQVRQEFPAFKFVKKSDSRLMSAIDTFLTVITFGQMKEFMKDFVTTLGTTVYVPDKWESWPTPSKMAVLRHERVHMRQAQKYGRLLYSLMYLLLPLPVGLAYFRMKFEKEAYEESLRAYAEYYGVTSLKSTPVRDSMVRHFTTAEYFWMWPFRKSLEKWYDDAVGKLS